MLFAVLYRVYQIVFQNQNQLEESHRFKKKPKTRHLRSSRIGSKGTTTGPVMIKRYCNEHMCTHTNPNLPNKVSIHLHLKVLVLLPHAQCLRPVSISFSNENISLSSSNPSNDVKDGNSLKDVSNIRFEDPRKPTGKIFEFHLRKKNCRGR